MLKTIAAVFLAVLTGSGCTSYRYYSSKRTPVDEAIIGYKRALVMAQEKTFLEEFVKYKQIYNTFALYRIDEAEVQSSVDITSSSNETANAVIQFPPSAGLGVAKNIEVRDNEGTKITIKLTPIGNHPGLYNEIKNTFDTTPGLGVVYGLASYDSSGKPTSEESGMQCRRSLYCIPIHGLTDPQGNATFAYLINNEEFRKLLNKIRVLDLPPKVEPSIKTIKGPQ